MNHFMFFEFLLISHWYTLRRKVQCFTETIAALRLSETGSLIACTQCSLSKIRFAKCLCEWSSRNHDISAFLEQVLCWVCDKPQLNCRQEDAELALLFARWKINYFENKHSAHWSRSLQFPYGFVLLTLPFWEKRLFTASLFVSSDCTSHSWVTIRCKLL